MSKKSECVKVVVRCRPMLKDEIASGFQRVVDVSVTRGMISLKKPNARADEVLREFTFDSVYDWNSKQIDLYDETFRPIVDAVLEGYNGTIFAYGQTGTGKTYTMEGNRNKQEERGVIPSSFDHIFTHIARTHDQQYLVRASYLEIYQDEVRDLLSKDHKKKLELRERPDTGVYVQDLNSFVAKSVREIEHVMTVGNQNRAVGRTNMNEHSSRSHAVFVVTVECTCCGADGEEHIRVGKLNLVDLAGSERQSKTASTGDRFKEATKINLSLSALGNVISALVDGKSFHVPYRDSKLTRLLQDSLGGNSKTVMVANIGPANYNYEESLMTLRYASRAKSIKNKPRINEDPKDALLREYQEEIQRLKTALEKRKTQGSGERMKGRRKKILTANGEVVSGDGSEEEEEEGENVSLKAQQEILEAEKQALLQNKELVDEEREKLIAQVQHRVDLLKKEQKKRDALAAKIKAMESKLLAGGKNIIDKTDEQQKALERQRQEMIEQKCREREILQQLEVKEESALEIRDTYTSLQEEVDMKTKKLHKLQSKVRAARVEITDYKEEQAVLREGLAHAVEELQRELMLKALIIENFIPAEEVQKVTERALFDAETDQWRLRPMQTLGKQSELVITRPMSTSGSLRPMSAFAKMAASMGDPRYMSENILKVELDMPNRTTRDYEGPLVVPRLQAALDAALQEEDEMTVDASAFTHTSQYKVGRSKTRLPQGKGFPRQQFPASRGLVTPTVRFA